MNSTIKSYIKKGILGAIALMSLLTLCFTLLEFNIGIGNPVVENGFSMMSFESKFIDSSHWGGAVLGVFSIIELIVSIILIALAAWNFVPNKGIKSSNLIIIVGAIIVAVLYLIEGAIFKSMVGEYLNDKYLTTAAFVPLILIVVLTAAYIIVEKFIKVNDSSIVINHAGKRQTVNINNELNTAESLKKYKELLDAGVITQEEFDEKKKQILGL